MKKIVLLLILSIILHTYSLFRYGGLIVDHDMAELTIYSKIVQEEGYIPGLVPLNVVSGYVYILKASSILEMGYGNGVSFQIILTILSNMTGLTINDLQKLYLLFFGAISTIAVVLLANGILKDYRKAIIAGAISLLSTDFLFITIRGSHDKFTSVIIMLLFYLENSLINKNEWRSRILLWIISFALLTYNVHFGILIMFVLSCLNLYYGLLKGRKILLLDTIVYLLFSYVFIYKIFTVAGHWTNYIFKTIYNAIFSSTLIMPAVILLIILIIILKDEIAKIFTRVNDSSNKTKTILLALSAVLLILLVLSRMGSLKEMIRLQAEYITNNYSNVLTALLIRIPDILLLGAGMIMLIGTLIKRFYNKNHKINLFLIAVLIIFSAEVFQSLLVSSTSALSNAYIRLLPYLLIFCAILISDNTTQRLTDIWKNKKNRYISITVIFLLLLVAVSKAVNEPLLMERYLFYVQEEVLGIQRLSALIDDKQKICSDYWCVILDYRSFKAFLQDTSPNEIIKVNKKFDINGRLAPVSLADAERNNLNIDIFNDINRVYDNGKMIIFDNNQKINLTKLLL